MANGGVPGTAREADGLRTAAKGWHGLQLAVLGFVGLCGVLKGSGPDQVPRGVQILAGVLALAALAVACLAVLLVGLVAWPLYGGARTAPAARAGRVLRLGIVLTFVAVVLLALSTAASWWPVPRRGATEGLVQVSTGAVTVCGALRGGGDGFLVLRADGRTAAVPLDRITALRPVSDCG
ncbi:MULTISPECIES: hypothetical protein [unclassified Streptomyces]|uniref:hypothetical protein n=1 Tax=unclassified Streptomyces TaxID=2593676 RepID=UPI003D765203